MQKIIPHLWYDTEALEAARFYVSLFEESAILGTVTLPDTPSGDAMSVDFKLANLRFSAISAGPYFQFNPSISLMVACDSAQEVDRLYEALSVGGTDLMPLDEYPFSKRYAWTQDRFGLSWQLMLTETVVPGQRIRPSLLFAGEACGKAEEALDLYVSVFKNSEKGFVNRYAEGEAMDSRAKINYAEARLERLSIVVMDHGYGADFTFNEAFTLMVLCENQAEIDYYWEQLSFVPEAEQCGWIKDRFGVSWQITPANMNEMDNAMMAKCGTYCGTCSWKEPCNCGGCEACQGQLFWGTCDKAICCIERGYAHCGICPDMPCHKLIDLFNDPEHGDDGARIRNLKNWAQEIYTFEKLR